MQNQRSYIGFEKILFGAGAAYLAYKLASSYANSNKKEGVACRDELTEKDIDEIVKESFPASDAPSTY